MRRIVCSILLCFFVLCLNADEFVVHHIHSNNILLKALAETIIEVNIKDDYSKILFHYIFSPFGEINNCL